MLVVTAQLQNLRGKICIHPFVDHLMIGLLVSFLLFLFCCFFFVSLIKVGILMLVDSLFVLFPFGVVLLLV